MKYRFLVMLIAACLSFSIGVVPIAGQTPVISAKTVPKASSPARTADGQPDIQGTWTNYDNTPFQAPSPEDAASLAALRVWFPPGDQTGPGDFNLSDGPAGASRPRSAPPLRSPLR